MTDIDIIKQELLNIREMAKNLILCSTKRDNYYSNIDQSLIKLTNIAEKLKPNDDLIETIKTLNANNTTFIKRNEDLIQSLEKELAYVKAANQSLIKRLDEITVPIKVKVDETTIKSNIKEGTIPTKPIKIKEEPTPIKPIKVPPVTIKPEINELYSNKKREEYIRKIDGRECIVIVPGNNANGYKEGIYYEIYNRTTIKKYYYINGKLHDSCQDYYDSGAIKEMSHYKHGLLHGWHILYKPNGDVISKYEYEYGKLKQ